MGRFLAINGQKVNLFGTFQDEMFLCKNEIWKRNIAKIEFLDKKMDI